MTIVASIGENNELGRGGDLCWHIREDLLHFKELTMGGAVIMGRKTWESLPRRPLPGRLNIVISSSADGAVRSLPEALAMAAEAGMEAYVIGGASVYAQAMPLADTLELTRIYASDPEADTFFPTVSPEEWEIERESEIHTSPEGVKYRYITYRRR